MPGVYRARRQFPHASRHRTDVPLSSLERKAFAGEINYVSLVTFWGTDWDNFFCILDYIKKQGAGNIRGICQRQGTWRKITGESEPVDVFAGKLTFLPEDFFKYAQRHIIKKLHAY